MNNKHYTIPAKKVWDSQKPKYNGFAVGHGPHKNKKAYTRKEKHKQDPVSWDLGSGLLACEILIPIGLLIIFG